MNRPAWPTPHSWRYFTANNPFFKRATAGPRALLTQNASANPPTEKPAASSLRAYQDCNRRARRGLFRGSWQKNTGGEGQKMQKTARKPRPANFEPPSGRADEPLPRRAALSAHGISVNGSGIRRAYRRSLCEPASAAFLRRLKTLSECVRALLLFAYAAKTYRKLAFFHAAIKIPQN